MSREEQYRDLSEPGRAILRIMDWIAETEKPRQLAVFLVVIAWVIVSVLSGCKEDEKEAAKEAVREFIAEEDAKRDAKKDEIWGDLNKSQRKLVPNPFETKKKSN